MCGPRWRCVGAPAHGPRRDEAALRTAPNERGGLSSWTARRAAHNHVDLPTLWAWLNIDPIDDLRPSPGTLERLAEVSGAPMATIANLCIPQVRRPAWMASRGGDGYRGGACPVCCREAAAEGRDHWWPAQSTMLLWVSCPIHRCALVDLDGLAFTPIGGVLKLTRQDGGALGAPRTLRVLSVNGRSLSRDPRWRPGRSTHWSRMACPLGSEPVAGDRGPYRHGPI